MEALYNPLSANQKTGIQGNFFHAPKHLANISKHQAFKTSKKKKKVISSYIWEIILSAELLSTGRQNSYSAVL